MHNPTRQILTAASVTLLLALNRPGPDQPVRAAKPMKPSSSRRSLCRPSTATATSPRSPSRHPRETQIKDLPFSVSVITSES